VIWQEDESVVSNAKHSIFSIAEIEKWSDAKKDWWLHYAYQALITIKFDITPLILL